MTLWPFKSNGQQKIISTLCLIIGVILFFGFESLPAGAAFSIFGLVYLLDTV